MCFKKNTPVGIDALGNKYYQIGEKRSVKYHSVKEPSLIPPAWHAWLHNSLKEIPNDKKETYSWQTTRIPNLTGTKEAYYPSNYPLNPNSQVNENTYYQPWNPN